MAGAGEAIMGGIAFQKDGFRFEALSYSEGWAGIEQEWARLFQSCARPCVFYHPLFLAAAAVLPRTSRPSHLIVGYQHGQMVLGLPVEWRWTPLRGSELRLYAGGGMGFDHLAPLDVTPGRLASRALCSCLGGLLKVQTLTGSGVAAEFADVCEEVAQGRLGCFRRPAFRCPYLALPGSKESLLGSLSRKFRYNLRRSLKQIEAESVSFRTLVNDLPGHTLQQALDSLWVLHAERTAATARESLFLKPEIRRYHACLCEQANRYEGTVRFVEAVQHGRVVGSLYGFGAGRRFYFYQSGFSEEFARYSLGSLLVYQTMVGLIEEQAESFDFLRGADEYKFKWTEVYTRDYLVVLTASPAAHVALALYRWRRAMRRQGRWAGTLAWLRGQD